MNRHVVFHVDPMSVPAIANRVGMVTDYAARFLRYGHENETASGWAEQAAADLQDKSIALEVKREIRRQRRAMPTL